MNSLEEPLEDEVTPCLNDQAKELLLLWSQTYRHTYGVLYKDGSSKKEQLLLLVGLITHCGMDLSVAKRCVSTMFTPDLAWVNNVSLRWLCKEENVKRFILPAAKKAERTGATDWKGERSHADNSCRIRRRRRNQ